MLTRALLALTAFVVCLVVLLGTGVWYLAKQKTTLADRRTNFPRAASVATTSHEGGEESPIFYRTIGQVPQSGNLSALDPLPEKPAMDQYTLEFGMLGREGDARRLLADLSAKGIAAYYTPLQNNGRVIFRVREGVYTNHAQALAASQRLSQAHGIAAKVVLLQ